MQCDGQIMRCGRADGYMQCVGVFSKYVDADEQIVTRETLSDTQYNIC